jgi:hypothetical protein
MYPVYVTGKENSRLMHVCQLITFGKLSNDVDTSGTGSVHDVASRVAISYGCPALF